MSNDNSASRVEGEGGNALPALARFPDHNRVDEMLGEQMAKAAQQYDEAVHELKGLHAEASLSVERLGREIEELRGVVGPYLDGDGKMTPKVAKAAVRLMDLERQYKEAADAVRATYAATLSDEDDQRPPIGGEMGTSVKQRAERASNVERDET